VKGHKPIEQYLGDLDDSLRVTLRRRQRILSEARSHLEEAAEAQQRRGESRAEAERLVTAAFGPPEEVAASYGTDGTSPIGRTAVGLADCCYRAAEYLKKPENREAIHGEIVLLAAVPCAGALIISLLDSSPLWALRVYLVPALVVVLFFVAAQTWTGLRSLPRPGYARRWLKLDRAAQRRIMCALREGATLADPREADFVAELRGRARGLRLPRFLFAPFAVLCTVMFVVSLALGDLDADAAGMLFLTLLLWWLLVTDTRRARQRAEQELLALDVLHDVAAEALETGGARLEECISPPRQIHPSPADLQFRLVPVGAAVPPVGVGAKRGMIQLWQEPDDQPQEFEADNAEELRELRKRLTAIVARRS
jgi:hypothetical protein